LEIALDTGPTPPELSVSFTTDEDNRSRPLALRRFLVPWAVPSAEGTQSAEAAPDPRLAQGDVERGRVVYHSEQIGCAKCHRLGDEGGRIGPDLGNLPQRDYASVLRDILDPNATLNPDYIGFVATLADGRTLSGVVLSKNEERLVIGDNTGKEIEIPASEVEQLAPSKVSVMPSNFRELLSEEQVADLMVFLLSERRE
jgi:putative heme-binding domain-containing protein